MPRPDDPAGPTSEARRFLVGGHSLDAKVQAPGLYVVSTPIGNLADITIRALSTLGGADLILAEDTRLSRRLLAHYGISAPLASYHEHNAAQMRPKILARLAQQQAIALISDAGTPLVSDPGYKLVREAAEAGHAVFAVPGASALLAGLVSAALPTDHFHFEGFLPAKAGARATRLAELAAFRSTLVIYESPHRVAESLREMAAAFGADRPAALGRELTKLFEEVRRGVLSELARWAEQPMKGEIVIVIGPPPPPAPAGEEEIDALLGAALSRLSIKDAATEVARATGQPRRQLYARAVELAGHR